MWTDPMQDSQQKEVRRLIEDGITALCYALDRRHVKFKRLDENTILVSGPNGRTIYTASDQLSDVYNGVIYLISEYNQTVVCTLSRIMECVDAIIELQEVQVDNTL